MKRRALLVLLGLVTLAPAVSAHYLWVTVEQKAGAKAIAHVYFEEAPAARDGGYLDPFVKRGKAWVRTPGATEPTALKLAEKKERGKRWLTAAVPVDAPRTVDSYGKFGVYRYGKLDVLLHYYARHIEAGSAEDLEALAAAPHLDLQLVPAWSEGQFRLRVLWKGEPAAGRPVKVTGPKGYRRNLKTDDKGEIRLRPGEGGRYAFLTNVELKEPGKDDGKPYRVIRHHGSLILRLPLAGAE